MLIDDLVEYCDEQYQSGECGACTGKDRCVNECDGNCKLCLDDIHFHGKDIETGLPSKNQVLIPAFCDLSKKIGRERIVWRYDPILSMILILLNTIRNILRH